MKKFLFLVMACVASKVACSRKEKTSHTISLLVSRLGDGGHQSRMAPKTFFLHVAKFLSPHDAVMLAHHLALWVASDDRTRSPEGISATFSLRCTIPGF